MKILITTGLSESHTGGPAQYGSNLKSEFEKLGHEVRLKQYGSVESALLKVWPDAFWADKILALDTFSVGLPSVIAAGLFRKKVIIRVGGDFVWSAYVNRTGKPLTLPAFYKNLPKLNFKEKIIFFLTKWVISKTDFLAFNTEWQKNIWAGYYRIPSGKSGVIRNFVPEKNAGAPFSKKNFIWAGRLIPEKNITMLKKFGVEIITGEPRDKILRKLKDSYAAVSLAFTDICPNFILEAASFDKPFIMTRETGFGELFPKGGIFVNPFDEVEVGKAFEAMQDENTYNKHAEELKNMNIGHSWSDLVAEIFQIWKKI
ncbi:MAG: hypothetical protein A3J09_02855 [Candidatus Zambryskibacteria bacterium RIFCSPLOWO2_02_FULL_51_21]|uniref:Glycosyl transferase family 1 domain-containing protein n=2 Tax=Parcubacteria group TaxID=1794811 RepID=A0A1F8DVJ8_9BACT|nr:MAG: hypothetical protein A2755_01515 [Candidatus Wolfebacteria bacterium RIFCSPHIGHO2_01_FULL_48_22]OHA97064.1 MAG: hypothetical protein A3D49_00015 [Candidatus Zambryskibacteria bacterium RIFCSPHIGHO2_02_FULL_43_37]OHB07564.1 MAG: hypothetical protein A2944_01655 [Candidatus Zambryskibacteria bacterium RIFCSPLOWO2_01_FULL_52_12]OHB11503.1 MAG: hypothetical protein A3J09_02855 [Candidatus Zambryskibacteria bacterium RIFCSPLOWO2_02_FULL_51_21]